MKTLTVTMGEKWRSLEPGKPILTVTIPLPPFHLGVAWVEMDQVVLGKIERRILFEDYERIR